jgi:23S rRNA (uracil1939-C5)-methyltransferase
VDRAARLPRETLRAAARALVERARAVVLVAASTHAGHSPQLLGDAPVLVWGEATVREWLGPPGLFVHASPGGFTQANREQAARIHQRVAHELERVLGALSGRHVVDAYAGSGAIGLALAARGAQVTLIESFAPALHDAERAARAQELAVEAMAGDAATALETLVHAGTRVDAIIVNPPRRGVAPAVRRACAELEPQALVYVSCEPDTLGRDLADLARLGLRTVALAPYDMMPHTDEVEAVAVLRPGPAAVPRVLHQEPDLVAVDKPAHEPTVAPSEGSLALLARVQAMPGLAEAVALGRLDADTSGVCLFACTPEGATRWAKALGARDTRKEYVALCRGITRPKGVVGGRSRQGPPDERREQQARTRYRRMAVVGGHSLLRLTVEHGRTHQLRRHLASIGHPVLGDPRYGHAPSNRHLGEKHGLDRSFLHCARIALAHPTAERRLEIESPLAGDLQMVFDRLARATPEAEPG